MISQEEAAYLRGPSAPATSSILTSSSKYLNSPLYRDLYAQMGLKKDGRDLPAAYLIPDIIVAHDELAEEHAIQSALEDEKERLKEFEVWLRKKFQSRFTPQDVSTFEPGTLGHAIHEFMVGSGMKIDFMFLDAPQSDMEYLQKRRVQTHDIEHMITGFDTSPVGEIALIAFNILVNTNYFSPALSAELNRFNGFLLSTSLMRANLHYPHVLPAYLDGIARAHEMANQQTRPLFMIEWENYFNHPITDIREDLDLHPAPPSDYWSWTFGAATG